MEFVYLAENESVAEKQTKAVFPLEPIAVDPSHFLSEMSRSGKMLPYIHDNSTSMTTPQSVFIRYPATKG